MTTTYRRTSNYECEELEDELVVMERDSQAMVTLNPAGRLVWEAIENRVTLDELETLFRVAFPDVGEDTMRNDILAVLNALVTTELAFIDEGRGYRRGPPPNADVAVVRFGIPLNLVRSEERRVGNESRPRGSPDH